MGQMRARYSQDTLEQYLLQWGAIASDLRKASPHIARIIAREVERDEQDPRDAALTRVGISNPVLANVQAMEHEQWKAVFAVHNAVEQWPRLWRDVVRSRYEFRRPWSDICEALHLTRTQADVCMSLILRELRVDLSVAGLYV